MTTKTRRRFNSTIPLTRHEALHNWPHWSDADRSFVSAEIDRLGATEFYRQPAGVSVLVVKPHAERASMWLRAGYIDYQPGDGHDDALPSAQGIPWMPLSRFSPRGPNLPHQHEADQRLCPSCNLLLPTTGVCDDCS